MTDKPQTTFYVAVVTDARGASMAEFAEAVKRARSQFGISLDTFVEMAQDAAAKDFRQALNAQLRQQMKVQVDADAETIKSFDSHVN